MSNGFVLEIHDRNILNDINAKRELDNLINSSTFDEDFDWYNSEYFIIGRYKNKLVGVVVYGITKIKDKEYPRFLHIIIEDNFKRSKVAYKMLKQSEQVFLKRGYNQIIAIIKFGLPSREMKIRYALKFGYKKYLEENSSEIFYKNIGV